VSIFFRPLLPILKTRSMRELDTATPSSGTKWFKAARRTFEGLERETTWTRPFFFAVLADTQLGMVMSDKEWDGELDKCRQAVEALNRLRPKFAIVCGDLVNMWPANDPEHPTADPEKRQQQVADFKEVMSGVSEDIPLVCVCGNHDVGNRPNAVTIEEYKREFGDDYLAFWAGGCRCIVLNSNLHNDPRDAMELYHQQHRWLLQQLEQARRRGAAHVLLFSHHPWFLRHENEGEEDLGTWTLTTPSGYVVKLPNTYFHIPKQYRQPVLAAAKKARVRAAFAGHWHQNAVLKTSFGMEMVITSAVGGQSDAGEGSGFRLVKVFRDDIVHEYFPLDRMPSFVSLSFVQRTRWDVPPATPRPASPPTIQVTTPKGDFLESPKATTGAAAPGSASVVSVATTGYASETPRDGSGSPRSAAHATPPRALPLWGALPAFSETPSSANPLPPAFLQTPDARFSLDAWSDGPPVASLLESIGSPPNPAVPPRPALSAEHALASSLSPTPRSFAAASHPLLGAYPLGAPAVNTPRDPIWGPNLPLMASGPAVWAATPSSGALPSQCSVPAASGPCSTGACGAPLFSGSYPTSSSNGRSLQSALPSWDLPSPRPFAAAPSTAWWPAPVPQRATDGTALGTPRSPWGCPTQTCGAPSLPLAVSPSSWSSFFP